jgi:opacity protein-like surface antigen
MALLLEAVAVAQPKFTEINSKTGAFSRMGFGARGIGMGNAMAAVTDGNLNSYYNPAVSVFQDENSFQTGYTVLALDRHLNFLNFTRRFDFGASNVDTSKKARRSAGISIGVIQSGVSKIIGADNQGIKTGDLNTNEYQFFVGLSNRFSDKFSAGLAVKIYYYDLYKDVTSTAVGLDLGAIYRYSDCLSFSFSLRDINAKYKWDTSPIYGQDGANTEDSFPLMKIIGASYNFKSIKLLTSAELEISNADSKVIRLGAEYNLYENLFVRAGVDQIDLGNSDRPAMPACGLSSSRDVSGVQVGFDYAFQVENYSASSRHVVGLSVNF